MWSPKSTLAMALVSAGCLLSGCATSRWVVSLPTPTSDKPTVSNGIDVYIHSVVDKRTFEVAPRSPDIPSLDPSEPQSDAIRSRAIARKRNTFGKALGDILLQEGQTVESLIHDALRQTLVANGYTVVETDTNLPQSSHTVDVHISKFWSWMNPGFWAITLSTEIATDITVKDGDSWGNQTISVKASDTFQTAAEDNWLSVLKIALNDYLSAARVKLK